MNDYQVCVVGGGISGLHTSYELAKKGVRVKLLEARARVGGRIHSPSCKINRSAHFDIGPSWFWPGQSNIENLVVELGLAKSVFRQHATGDSLYEPIGTPLQRGISGISMAGSFRLDGGLRVVTEALAENIVKLAGVDSLSCNAAVSRIEKSSAGIVVHYAGNSRLRCDSLLIAIPPRVAVDTISFSPILNKVRVEELNAVATWMAGHAKVVVIYEQAFWRDASLSGDVISQRGPLSEIHDASSQQGVHALFGFFATPPKDRKTEQGEIEQQVVAQLLRIFGEPASKPTEIIYKDWAKDAYTATKLDHAVPNHHPSNYWSSTVEREWGGRLIWSGTEAASGHYNGYIEGALIASNFSIANLTL